MTIALLSDPNEETLNIVAGSPLSRLLARAAARPKEGSSAYTTSETAAAAFGNGVDGSHPTAHLLLPPKHGGFELDMGFDLCR